MLTILSVRDALYRAGYELQKGSRDPLHFRDIAERTIRYAQCAFGSVVPADYAYNLINRAPFSCSDPFFVFEGRARYHFVDRGFAYTGDIVWRPVGGKPRVVGHWLNGKQQLSNDPRRLLSVD